MRASVFAPFFVSCLFLGQFRPIVAEIGEPFKNCYEILQNGDTESGVRTLYPLEGYEYIYSVDVFCNQNTDEGGWTEIQKRDLIPDRENFYRSWDEYAEGFGDITSEFWLGLEHIHALTSSTEMELRLDLEDLGGEQRFAKYGTFHVGNSSTDYVLSIGNYSGDAGDGFTPDSVGANLNGMKFSTHDRDNDHQLEGNCAKTFKGAWWFNDCYRANLNGIFDDGIIWVPFHKYYSLKKVTMKIRPVTKKEVNVLPTTLKPELEETVTKGVTVLPTTQKLSKNCAELKLNGDFASGVYLAYPNPSNNSINVFCDQLTDGGGWTVIQNRDDLPVRISFERSWQDYVGGFGDLEGEFWLGLDNIHALTSSTPMQLRVDMEDWDGVKRFAKYSTFRVGDPASKYLLSVEGYTGDAGDGGSGMTYNNGNVFSTYDSHSPSNCGKLDRGGWWFKHCTFVNPNGYQHQGNYASKWEEGIVWRAFRGFRYSLKKISLKIRPV